jgi:enamine deaminase RidA (YjgF/YER057c/UK114 family)
VQVGEVGHKGTLVEIEPTALVPGQRVQRRTSAGKACAHMSGAVEAAGIAFLSGIPGIGRDGGVALRPEDLAPGDRELCAGAPETSPVIVQAAAALAQLRSELGKLGRDLCSVAHLTVFLANIEEFLTVAPLLEKAFGATRPALAVAEVPQPAPIANAAISLTAIASTSA